MSEFLKTGRVVRESTFEMINLIFYICYINDINVTLRFVNDFAVKPPSRLRLIVP